MVGVAADMIRILQVVRKPESTDEAILITNDNFMEVAKWCGGKARTNRRILFNQFNGLDAPMEAWPGDYMVKRMNEFYVLSQAEFEEIYSVV